MCALSQLLTHVGDEKLNDLPSTIRSVKYATAGSQGDMMVTSKLNPNAERIPSYHSLEGTSTVSCELVCTTNFEHSSEIADKC